jgi:hypothetical protein
MGSSTGSAYDAVRATGYRRERLDQIQVVREPSPAHLARSRALVEEFASRRVK